MRQRGTPQPSTPPDATLEGWIERYGDGLLRLCFMQLGDHALAEDAVQEAFIRAWRHYDRFEHRSSEKTWLTAIAVNVCRSMRRSPWRARTVSLADVPEPATDGDALPDGTVTRAVMALPPAQREVILMHELQGLKLREIAEARQLPLATVGARLRRAKQRLRRDLEGWYFDEE